MVTDAWYIDLDTHTSCDIDRRSGAHTYVHLSAMDSTMEASSAPIEKVEFVDHSAPEMGFAIESKMTSQNTSLLPDGSKKEYASISETRVTELVEGPLDPQLFSVPPGFRHVGRIERNPSPTLAEQWSAMRHSFKLPVVRFF
jgi:hypothetical protein